MNETNSVQQETLYHTFLNFIIPEFCDTELTGDEKKIIENLCKDHATSLFVSDLIVKSSCRAISEN